LVVLLLRQHSITHDLQSNFAALLKDRDLIRHELQKVNSQVADLQRASAAGRVVTLERESSSAAVKPAEAPQTTLPTDQTSRPAESVATPRITVTPPHGWWRNGKNPENYVVGVDTLETWGGMPSAYVKSVGETKDSFGGMMQTASAENYSGKRVRLNAWLKTEDANDGGGHLWLRIDGQERGQILGFDNMDNRPLKGTADTGSLYRFGCPGRCKVVGIWFFCSR
jgi:hypothetical protein